MWFKNFYSTILLEYIDNDSTLLKRMRKIYGSDMVSTGMQIIFLLSVYISVPHFL